MGIHRKEHSHYHIPHPKRSLHPMVSGNTLLDYATFWDEFTGTVAAGSVDGTSSSDGNAKRNVTDTESKLSINDELTLAGGKATPAWGDPMLTYSTLADGAFITAPCRAILLSPTFDSAGDCRWGFATSVAGTVPSDPSMEASVSLIRKRPGARPIIDAGYSVEATVIQYSRSSTNGYLMFVHVGAKQWSLEHISEDAVISGVDAFVKVSDYSKPLSFSRIALLNFSSLYTEDFVKLTDSETNPVTGTNFNCDADCHVAGSVTVEDTKYVYVYIRYTDVNNWVRMSIGTDRVVKLEKNVAGGGATTVDTGSTLTDAVSYSFDIVAEDPAVEIFIDGVSDASGTITDHTSVAQGRAEHDLASNDLVLETHPYPALGPFCADRVIRPQSNDTGTMASDGIVRIVGINI